MYWFFVILLAFFIAYKIGKVLFTIIDSKVAQFTGKVVSHVWTTLIKGVFNGGKAVTQNIANKGGSAIKNVSQKIAHQAKDELAHKTKKDESWEGDTTKQEETKGRVKEIQQQNEGNIRIKQANEPTVIPMDTNTDKQIRIIDLLSQIGGILQKQEDNPELNSIRQALVTQDNKQFTAIPTTGVKSQELATLLQQYNKLVEPKENQTPIQKVEQKKEEIMVQNKNEIVQEKVGVKNLKSEENIDNRVENKKEENIQNKREENTQNLQNKKEQNTSNIEQVKEKVNIKVEDKKSGQAKVVEKVKEVWKDIKPVTIKKEDKAEIKKDIANSIKKPLIIPSKEKEQKVDTKISINSPVQQNITLEEKEEKQKEVNTKIVPKLIGDTSQITLQDSILQKIQQGYQQVNSKQTIGSNLFSCTRNSLKNIEALRQEVAKMKSLENRHIQKDHFIDYLSLDSKRKDRSLQYLFSKVKK